MNKKRDKKTKSASHLESLHAKHRAPDVRRASYEPQIVGIGTAPLLLVVCRSAPPRVAQAVAIHPARGVLHPSL